jgi:hypothetical protein
MEQITGDWKSFIHGALLNTAKPCIFVLNCVRKIGGAQPFKNVLIDPIHSSVT